MKNKEIEKVFEEIDNGTITLEEANERLKEAGAPYHLEPWKNHIGRNDDGAGLMDTGTGTLDKVKVIEEDGVAKLVEPAFNAVQFKEQGAEPPYVLVQYGEVWHKVSPEDGVTLLSTKVGK